MKSRHCTFYSMNCADYFQYVNFMDCTNNVTILVLIKVLNILTIFIVLTVLIVV